MRENSQNTKPGIPVQIRKGSDSPIIEKKESSSSNTD